MQTKTQQTMLQSRQAIHRLCNRVGDALRAIEAPTDVPTPSSGRYEFKYLIRDDQAESIARFLSTYLELDKYSAGRPDNLYTVRSIYYDSPGFTCYYEKANGEKNRRKYRVRTYNHLGIEAASLECKQRRGTIYTKRKELLGEGGLAALRERAGLDASIAAPSGVLGQLLLCMDRWEYSPTSLVVYDREAYVAPGQQDTIRVTFDRNLRVQLFPELDAIDSDADLDPLLYGWTILEVKFSDVVPRFLGDLTSLYSLQRQACSKYGLGIALLLDETPTRKEGWNHVYVR